MLTRDLPDPEFDDQTLLRDRISDCDLTLKRIAWAIETATIGLVLTDDAKKALREEPCSNCGSQLVFHGTRDCQACGSLLELPS